MTISINSPVKNPLKFGAVCIQPYKKPSPQQISMLAADEHIKPEDGAIWQDSRRAKDGGMVYYVATKKDAAFAIAGKAAGYLQFVFAAFDQSGKARRLPEEPTGPNRP